MIETDSISGWHAHIYFDAATKAQARALCKDTARRFGVAMGRMHDGPVGPHPVGSCQLSVPPAAFAAQDPLLLFLTRTSADSLRAKKRPRPMAGASLARDPIDPDQRHSTVLS